MYFKKLELFGFKSFADKTAMNFGPGITAVIGPNGCGKSNVFDAIRWVLGEQSVKELRGSSMEDVIFNGTDKKAALGFAEVSLTFANESKMLPVEYDEVTVTRRLFRSGESEYLLNKTAVRLKDITELFMGTGIGAEAYSLVQQGKVDLVVSARPEERRVVLDEASGITKYKSKRKEALNKLKDTENNLLRINDIVTEVKRQISSLERQANKARRYKEEFKKLKHLEVKFANDELNNTSQQHQKMQEQMQAFREQENKLTAELDELRELLAHEANMLEELEERVNEVTAEDIKIDGQLDINSRQIGFDEERIENIVMNEGRISEKKEQLLERCRLQHQKIEEVQQAMASLEATLEKNVGNLKERKENLGRIMDSIQEAHRTIQSEEESILDISSKQVQVKNKLTEIMKEIQGCLARKRRLEMENTKVVHEKEEVDVKMKATCEKRDLSHRRIQELTSELAEQNRSLNDLLTQLKDLEGTIDDLEKKKLFLKSQKEFIEKLSVQYEDMPDPVASGRFFTETKPLEHQSGFIGKVKEVLPVGALKAAAIRSNFAGNPQQLYEIICETKFIELDPQQISEKIDEISHAVGEKIVQREDILSKVEQQKQMVGRVEANIQEQEKTISIYEAQQQDISSEASKLVEELELVKIELDEVVVTLSSSKISEEESVRYLDVLNQGLNDSQFKIKAQQDFISSKIQEREETTVSIAQLETEIAAVEDRKRGHAESLKTFSETLDHSLEEINRIEDEYGESREKKEQFKQDIEQLQARISELKEQKQSLRGVLSNYEKQKEEVSQRTNGVQANITSYTGDLNDVREKIHAQQMNEQEITFKEKEIKDRLLQTYKIELDVVNQELTQETAQPEEYFDPEALQVAIERLKKRCDSFGSVNLVAIEEFEELKERFEFLTKQQSDLITSKESLRQTINKINRQTRQMFMDTFTKVSEEFRIYFRMLFGGGDAQLILLDPENVLESGIEIIARPPGKKLQTISLLSGGEKTLTAIALIFGVFKVNPSPFCVLDEIDAALDESNVGRYAYLLKDFAKIAQFIVITHNKKTIENADVMYGITMQETGVSKVVSVKFSEKEEQKDHSPAVMVGA